MESLQPAWICSRLPTDFHTMSDPEPLPSNKTRRRQPSTQNDNETHPNKTGKKEKSPLA